MRPQRNLRRKKNSFHELSPSGSENLENREIDSGNTAKGQMKEEEDEDLNELMNVHGEKNIDQFLTILENEIKIEENEGSNYRFMKENWDQNINHDEMD